MKSTLVQATVQATVHAVAKLAVAGMSVVGVASFAHAQTESEDIHASDLRAPSPAIEKWDRPGYFQVGAGPSFASGLQSNTPMYNLNAAYNFNLSKSFTLKGIADLNHGTSANSARLVTLGGGIEAYFSELDFAYGVPYFGVDAGYGFARNDRNQTKDSPVVGAGAGFKFAVQELNLDASLHYSVVTAELNGVNPTVFGMRLSTNF